MTDMSIALQEVKVRALKCAWDNACNRFDFYGTLLDLFNMQEARRSLVDAEDKLAEMKQDERYDPYQAVNARPFDPDQTEAFELAHPGILM